ncbi:hypothetical protein B0T21DRAFT_387833 [Apiosordaria backusii]|uniref:APSES transcription factor Xbp1 n=1 Tax=Apiosordaria backusii TaxID=314023 RepID=A0AA39ZVE3_9PEZI|nr:hypothetical protein B0T21DRAFT_387833 [Apiosordaria backusii]
MVSVASLLNPEPPRAPLPSSRPSQFPLPSPRPTAAFTPGPSSDRPATRTSNMQDHHRPVRHTVKGMVNYPPFEDLDADSLREVQRFQVSNLRLIQSNCRRIPYHSQKKDFYQKTGRESFEVFEYSFKLPRDSRLRSENTYTVMWDYNVGLVRMTPFFKCLEYSKVCLSQRWDVVGDSYWMPYPCAKAVCATFCHEIAGALIPLFGPSFPSECIREGMPGYKHMVIDPEIVAKARLEARRLLDLPTPRSGPLLSPRLSRSVSPRPCPRPARLTEPYNNRIDYDPPMLLSPHSNADQEFYASSSAIYSQNMATDLPPSRYGGIRSLPVTAPVPSSRWATQRQQQHHYQQHHEQQRRLGNLDIDGSPRESGANPWLSAVPRLPSPYPQRDLRSPIIQSTALRTYERPILPPIRSIYHRFAANKRTFDQMERPASSRSTPAFDSRPDHSYFPRLGGPPPTSRSLSPSIPPTRQALEEDAALTLMQLCEKSNKQEPEHGQEQKRKDENAVSAAGQERPHEYQKSESSTNISRLTVIIGSPACSSEGETRVGSEDAELKMEKASALASPGAGVVAVASTPDSLTAGSSSSSDADDEDDDDYNEDQSPRGRGRSKRRRVMS